MIDKLLSFLFQSPQEEDNLFQFQLVSAMDENTCLDCLELDESETMAPMP